MSAVLLDLALFPLNTVLFPGFHLPLQIFEARYRQMIGRCINENLPFGVVLISVGLEVGGPAQTFGVGTVASITTSEKLPDGRFKITALGIERFRVLAILQELPYAIARVQIEVDVDSPPGSLRDSADEVRLLLEEYVAGLRQVSRKDFEAFDPPSDPESLAWFVAATLPISLPEKQQILEVPDVVGRLTLEAEILRRERLFVTRFGALSPEDRALLQQRKRSLN